jgi:hypothetical protein
MSVSPSPSDLGAKRARFLRFDGGARLGNLASTLMRAADQANDEGSAAIVNRMLVEARLFLSWDDTARDSKSNSSLIAMHAELARLERRWNDTIRWDAALAAEVAAECRAYSNQALSLSGLLEEQPSPE